MICNKTSSPAIPQDLLDFVKSYLKITDTDSDVLLQSIICGVIDKFTSITCYSVLVTDYTCTYDVSIKNTTNINDCGWLELAIIYPNTVINKVKVNGDVITADCYKLCGYVLKINILSISGCCDYCVEVDITAGNVDIPCDIKLLIAMEVEKIYDCGCICDQKLIEITYNKYNKKRFLI